MAGNSPQLPIAIVLYAGVLKAAFLDLSDSYRDNDSHLLCEIHRLTHLFGTRRTNDTKTNENMVVRQPTPTIRI